MNSYLLHILDSDEETIMQTQEYATLRQTARAMLAAYDLNTEPGLLDENGEMTLRVEGAGSRPLTKDESLSLFALVVEFGGNMPDEEDAETIGWLRFTNPNRRS